MPMLGAMRGAWLIAVLLGWGCGESHSQIFVNAGSLCLRHSGERLRAEVKLPGCISSACKREVASACTIQQEEQQISVSSRLVMEPNGFRCANDCGIWISSCDLPAPAPGDYSVAFGDLRAAVAFPLSLDTELLPDGTTRGCASGEPLPSTGSDR